MKVCRRLQPTGNRIVKRLILFGLLAGLLTANSGCGLLQAVFCYRPCLGGGQCGPAVVDDGCGESCGPTCGPVHRPVRAVASAPRRAVAYGDCDTGCDVAGGRPCRRAACGTCGSCGDPCADPCGQGCYGRTWHRGPLSCIFALFSCRTWWGGNCGERYWGDFYSDPPDCWDPCDGCGNYTGGGCRSCGGGSNNGSGVFDEYSSGPVGSRVDDGAPVAKENIVSQTDRAVSPAPRPVAQPHKANRP